MKTFTLKELGKYDIDAWVEAVSALSDDPVAFAYAVNNSTDDEIAEWLEMDRCAGELERAFAEYAEKNNIRFDENGKIVH